MTTSTDFPNIDEFKAEYDQEKAVAEQNALAAKQKEREEAHERWVEQQKKQQQARVDRENRFARRIIPHLSGYNVERVGEGFDFTINGINIRHYIYTRSEYPKYHYGNEQYVKHSIYVTQAYSRGYKKPVGYHKRYPMRKDGMHKYKQIACDLAEMAIKRKEELARIQTRENNQVVVDKFIADNKLSKFDYDVRFSGSAVNDSGPITVRINITRTLTVEKAQKLVDNLIDVGLLKREQ